MRRKIYYVFRENEQGHYWRGSDGSKLFFCGHPKFIVDALIKKFGIDRAQEVFNDFMEGVRSISDMKYINDGKTEIGTFVLYKHEKDDNQEPQSCSPKKIQSDKKESTKDGKDSLKEDIG